MKIVLCDYCSPFRFALDRASALRSAAANIRTKFHIDNSISKTILDENKWIQRIQSMREKRIIETMVLLTNNVK